MTGSTADERDREHLADPTAAVAVVGGAEPRRAARLATELMWPSDRWRHLRATGRRAEELAAAGAVDADDLELLVASAWLHDIGYAPELAVVGFHPLDGANHLAVAGWPSRLAALVAHHSGARFVAAVLGLDGELTAYPYEDGPVADALTYADQTTGPHGEWMRIPERIRDRIARHGPDAADARVREIRDRYLLEVASRVERRMFAASTHAGSSHYDGCRAG